jgi:hypothetical protein
MRPTIGEPVAMSAVLSDPTVPPTRWLWDGYLARGAITLLTGRWKTGKTTLLAGLLRSLAAGEPFLGRACVPSDAVVVSEESRQMWATRLNTIPIGERVRLLARPFPGRPTPAEWDEFARRAEGWRAAGQLDLLVVDPLSSFLPGRSDSDPATLLALLDPLRRLADAGVAVLVLHHPRKEAAEEGSTARGSGALLGYVDVILELHPCGRLGSDANLRRLVSRSRHPDTPPRLTFEWTPKTADFRPVDDPTALRFRQNWEKVKATLAGRRSQATHRELLEDWPADEARPTASELYKWLNRAAGEKLVKRTGAGTKSDPYRFRLPRADDLPELPPLEDVLGLRRRL